MENIQIFLPYVGIGLVYFFIIMFLNKRFHIRYITGLWLPLAIVVVFFILAMVARFNPQPGSWSDLIFAALTSVFFVILLTYLAAWGIITLIHKKS